MNKVVLTGRLCRETELRTLPTGSITTDFTIAVDRRKKDAGADFIQCVAWGKTAEMLNQYVHKGEKVGVVGRLQVREYVKDGNKRYVTEVVAEEIEFMQIRRDYTQAADEATADGDGLTPSEDEDLPFI